ncbi:MAG: GNAT family N-acetyltransferase [Planctomycetota bacterium]|jgi:ribosomal protein S18 acetylase RimI-like enzyme
MQKEDMVEIKQLSTINIETVHEAHVKAFAHYVEPFALSFQQFKYMLERRGCNLDLSFGAFNNNELVGFVLNGIGTWNGRLTAYDTGTGIIKTFRKKGIAARMLSESLPVLRDNNMSQYLLEVIRTNTPAYDLYKKAGFEVTREFDYYISTKDKVVIRGSKLSDEFPLREIDDPDWDLFRTFWDFVPSWQNSIDSISRKFDRFTILGMFDNDNIVGYGVIEKETGDIPQLGIDKEHRRQGLGTTLLHRLLQYSESDEIKILNVCAGNVPFKKFAGSIKLTPGLGQYEMLLKL